MLLSLRILREKAYPITRALISERESQVMGGGERKRERERSDGTLVLEHLTSRTIP
jgi:hypothetical protein